MPGPCSLAPSLLIRCVGMPALLPCLIFCGLKGCVLDPPFQSCGTPSVSIPWVVRFPKTWNCRTDCLCNPFRAFNILFERMNRTEWIVNAVWETGQNPEESSHVIYLLVLGQRSLRSGLGESGGADFQHGVCWVMAANWQDLYPVAKASKEEVHCKVIQNNIDEFTRGDLG